MARIETISVQGNYKPQSGEPRVVPIAQSTTYKYNELNQLADLFDLKAAGYFYSRIGNPTVAALEEKVALLEGGVAALATSSGQAANTFALLNILKTGDNFLLSSKVYGGSINVFENTFKKFGIDVIKFDLDSSAEEIKALANEKTKAIFGETISNPTLEVLDLEKIVSVGKDLGVPVIVDASLTTPYLLRPLDYGVNIVTHSSTKYLDGHAAALGGIIVDGGNFDWNNGKFPELVEPDPTYHGLSYTETFGNQAYIVKARVQLLRDLGSCQSPFNAYITNQNLETLHLRLARHSENALAVAKFLESHKNIESVNYPGLESNKYYENAKKYLPKGASGVLSFNIKGSIENAKIFVGKLKLVALVTHVADVRTSVIHPASTTHRQLSEEELLEIGISPTLIRLSVGIENVDDIIEDLSQALDF
ncbi:MAG: O-acetylhomoserine aminocarboxypropyltransferase/cysteine synthase [Clostridioides sp.]|jgi:O-acetylhomoserine (thiol)-lyase|nr:O-acetylhomoserine aminocarboxypropyltransferase/cysteine synthase [Clostridioides sp.]